MDEKMREMGIRAKHAAGVLATLTTEEKNAGLLAIADALRARQTEIMAANALDLEAGKANGMSPALLDRLALNGDRIEGMAQGCQDVADLPDPCGRVLESQTRPNGLYMEKVSVPIGVIGIVYEARPNVTVDGAALCLKSGNAVILRGGKEAIHSNRMLAQVMRDALFNAGIVQDAVALVQDTSRTSATEMMHMKGYIDCLIPRGGKGLIAAVCENATVPVIETGSGNCHIYVDATADVDMAADIIFNAKTQRIGVCNACESLVIHQDIIDHALPAIKLRLDEKNVELRGDARAMQACDGLVPATEEDFYTEYLDYIISVKTVKSVDEAIDFINVHSTGHSEAIITRDEESARRFLQRVDSAAVYVNASTRFTDGAEFGLGAEIGISTQKLHARGPMGLRALTTTKYLIFGNGQVR